METRVAFTLSARRRFDELVPGALEGVPLGAWTQVGDHVALGGAESEGDDFVVIRRRILPRPGQLELELTLDWPARDRRPA